MIVWVSVGQEAAPFRKRVVLSALQSTCSLEVVCAAAKQQANNETEQTKDGREDLNDQDLDEKRRVRSISQSSAGTVDANTDTANQVAHADQHSAPEQCVTGVVVAAGICCVAADLSQFGGEDNAHDDTVNSNDLTEDNGDQVLGADARRLHTTTEDRSSSDEDSPCSANDGETDTKADA